VIDNVGSGLAVTGSNRTVNGHGTCAGKPTHEWTLYPNGSEAIVEVVVRMAVDSHDRKVIASIAFATSVCRVFDSAARPAELSDQEDPSLTPTDTITWSHPEHHGQWNLRGFFSYSHLGVIGAGYSPIPCTLGVVWSKDTFVPLPAAALLVPF
jgi:hypothetical protein